MYFAELYAIMIKPDVCS